MGLNRCDKVEETSHSSSMRIVHCSIYQRSYQQAPWERPRIEQLETTLDVISSIYQDRNMFKGMFRENVEQHELYTGIPRYTGKTTRIANRRRDQNDVLISQCFKNRQDHPVDRYEPSLKG